MNVAQLHEILTGMVLNGGGDRAIWIRDIFEDEWAFEVEADDADYGRVYLQATMALLLLE